MADLDGFSPLCMGILSRVIGTNLRTGRLVSAQADDMMDVDPLADAAPVQDTQVCSHEHMCRK